MNNWNELDDDAVKVARALAMDAVQKVGNGHPGTAMALAPAAYLLFQKYLKHSPKDPNWLGRDRFVLSAGHSSLTLYIQLFLSGYGLELEDLKSFRTLNSKTPGHPEFGHTKGVEITTGPLGSGISSAVGMAMATRFEKGLFDPEGKTTLFDHNIWVIASDGDLQEGISAEVIDLRTIRPLDWETILESVKKTNRLVIVEEQWPFASVSSELSYRIQKEGFDYLDAPIRRITAADAPMHYAPNLVAAYLPDVTRTVKLIKEVMYIQK